MKKSRKDKWEIELDVLFLLLWSDPKAWLVVLLWGQWSAPPCLTKPLFITSLISRVCGSQLKPGSAALGAWGEALCFFAFLRVLNHPFETHSQSFPSVALRLSVGSSADTEHQSVRWEEPFPGDSSSAVCQLHLCSSSCFYPAAVGFNSVPPLAGGETVMSSLSPLLHSFPQALGLSSPVTALGAGCDSFCSLLTEVWAELSENLMHSRRMSP